MPLFNPRPDDTDLIPEVISIARCQALRIRRIGVVFFVESKHIERTTMDDGAEVITDAWKVVAIAKPDLLKPRKDSPRKEAFDFMHEAQALALEQQRKDQTKGAKR